MNTNRNKMVLTGDESKALMALLRAEQRPLDEIVSDFNTGFPHALRQFTACISLSTLLQASSSLSVYCSLCILSMFACFYCSVGSLICCRVFFWGFRVFLVFSNAGTLENPAYFRVSVPYELELFRVFICLPCTFMATGKTLEK